MKMKLWQVINFCFATRIVVVSVLNSRISKQICGPVEVKKPHRYLLWLSSYILRRPKYSIKSLTCLWYYLKLNYRQKVFFFALNFHPWEFWLIKKLEIEKTKTTQYTTLKTHIIRVVLFFFNFKLFNNKNSQGRKLSVV